MTAFTIPNVVATGQTLHASDINTLANNLNILFTHTASGDIAIANSASTLAKLSIPASGKGLLYSALAETLKSKWDYAPNSIDIRSASGTSAVTSGGTRTLNSITVPAIASQTSQKTIAITTGYLKMVKSDSTFPSDIQLHLYVDVHNDFSIYPLVLGNVYYPFFFVHSFDTDLFDLYNHVSYAVQFRWIVSVGSSPSTFTSATIVYNYLTFTF
jgi:hypothetical protein